MTDPKGASPPPHRLDDLVAELAELLGDEPRAARAVAALREEFLVPLPEVLADEHLATMRAAAAASGAASPGIIDLRSRRVRRAVAGSAVALLALGTTGGLAAAGMLPPVLQDALSRAASVVSIDLPRSTTLVDLPDAPGITGEVPGATAPGQTGATPGQTGETPGQTGATPGQTGETPGATAPGRTGATPGQTGETPGATAPGQTGATPGQTGETPPSTGTAPPGDPPGQSGDTPAPTAPGATAPGSTAPGQGGGQESGRGGPDSSDG
jgi:hypothetical protein